MSVGGCVGWDGLLRLAIAYVRVHGGITPRVEVLLLDDARYAEVRHAQGSLVVAGEEEESSAAQRVPRAQADALRTATASHRVVLPVPGVPVMRILGARRSDGFTVKSMVVK